LGFPRAKAERGGAVAEERGKEDGEEEREEEGGEKVEKEEEVDGLLVQSSKARHLVCMVKQYGVRSTSQYTNILLRHPYGVLDGYYGVLYSVRY
jgi:hypothetical protein